MHALAARALHEHFTDSREILRSFAHMEPVLGSVCLCVCVSVTLNLSSRVFVRLTKDTTY